MTIAKSRIEELINGVQSDAMAIGHFAGTFGSEPLGAPSVDGLTLAVWVDEMAVLPGRGLASSGMRLAIFVRIYAAAVGLSEYRDDIDPSMMSAAADLFGLVIGGYTVGGFASFVDVKGQYGEPLQAKAGHLTLDKKIFRVYDTIVPLIVDDLWIEAP